MDDKNIVAQWQIFAKMDLDCAKHLFENMRPQPLEIICYHCQQCAEKIMKSVLILNGIDPQKTHDLSVLADRLQEFYKIDEEILDICDELTPFGVKVRYPQEIAVDEYITKKVIAKCQQLYEWFESKI